MEFVGIMTGAVALGKVLWDKHEIYKRNKTIFLNLETCIKMMESLANGSEYKDIFKEEEFVDNIKYISEIIQTAKTKLENFNKKYKITKFLFGSRFEKDIQCLTNAAKLAMDLIHSKISTKTHIKIDLMEEKLNRVHLDVKSVKKQQKEMAENFIKFQEYVQAQMMFFREQFENLNSNQTLILRNLEYHQLKIPEATKEFFNGNSAYFDAVDEEEKQTNFDTINDDSDGDLSEIFQSERYSESDNTSMIFDEKVRAH